MEGSDTKNDLRKVSLFEFRHNLGLLLDTRYNPLGLQISHIEKEYGFWFANCQSVNLKCLETHEKSWIGLFKNEILLKDRFFVSTKNGAQYVRSNPDKLAEESKELFDFANYKELQQRKQRSDEKKTDAETQTDTLFTNVVMIPQDPNHSSKSTYCEFMPETPPVTTPPLDADPNFHFAHATDGQNEQYSGASNYFRLNSDANCQNSTDSASTDFLHHEDTQKIYDEFKTQKMDKNEDKVKIKKELTDFKIEPEETYDDGDLLENAPVDNLELHPATSLAVDSERRGGSTNPYCDDYQYRTNVETERLLEDQMLEESDRDFPDLPRNGHFEESAGSSNANTSYANTNTKRKLTSNRSYDSDYDYEHKRVAKSPRLHKRQAFEENLPLHDNLEIGSTNPSPTKRTSVNASNIFDYEEYDELIGNDQSELPNGEGSNIFEYQPDQLPKYMQGSDLVTGINMAKNLLVQLTELVEGNRSARRLQGSSPKSAVRDRWTVYPLQNKGLGIYLSDGDGTPFYWNDNRWDPNVPNPVPKSQPRPPSFKLPPNSLIYGEFVEVDYVSRKLDAFIEFNVIDIAALDWEIFEVGFTHRRSICHSYLATNQGPQRCPKIYVGMKPVRELTAINTWNILRLAYVRDGTFNLTRSKTCLEITAIGLSQLCPNRDMSGRNGFVFSMNRRYILKAPSPSRPSLLNYVSKELSKIFKDYNFKGS